MRFEKHIKTGVFAFFCLLFIIPVVQKNLEIFHLKGLRGAFTPAQKPVFSKKTWKDLSFQKAYEQYINDNVGMRPFIIRAYNQLYYSLFSIAKTRDVIIGRNNVLYERNYIEEYLGMNFKGRDGIEKEMKRAKYVQDTLKKIGIDFIIVFAPGKASFFPDDIPERYSREKTGTTNYKVYTETCRKYGVNHLDLNRYFVSLKATSKYPLMSAPGIHWTFYGMTVALDTLLQTIEHMRHIDLPDMIQARVELPDTARDTDCDVAEGLNLLFPVSHPQYAYPIYNYNTSGKTMPRLLTVGDSYYWTIYGNGITHRLFSDGAFWFYNEECHPMDNSGMKPVSTLDLQKEVEKNEIIMLISTEANLYRFSWGFIDNLYRIYAKDKSDTGPSCPTREDRMNHYRQMIRSDEGWMKSIRVKAADNGVSVDEMIEKDAAYMLEKELKK